jgi:hypothetical protein
MMENKNIVKIKSVGFYKRIFEISFEMIKNTKKSLSNSCSVV